MFSQIWAKKNDTHNGEKKVEQREKSQGEWGMRKGTDERHWWGSVWASGTHSYVILQDTRSHMKILNSGRKIRDKQSKQPQKCLDSQKQPSSPESTIASVGCFTWVKRKGLFCHPHNESPRETADVKDMQDFYLLECYVLLLAGWIDGSFKQIQIKEKVSQTPLIP